MTPTHNLLDDDHVIQMLYNRAKGFVIVFFFFFFFFFLVLFVCFFFFFLFFFLFFFFGGGGVLYIGKSRVNSDIR